MASTAIPRNPHPLELERVQSSRAEPGELRLRLSGRWVDPQAEVGDDDELLVVNVEGRRHRFPATRDERSDAELGPGRWSASFKIPTWAEPREEGQAALWVGDAVIPVPPLDESVGATRKLEARPRRAPDAKPRSSQPADGPLADTVAALQAELEQRTADTVEIRAALANTQAELEARSSTGDRLETTLVELRGELDRLQAAVQAQRETLRERSAELAELRDQVAAAEATAESREAEASTLRGDLAAANVSREAAVNEAAGLRSELERIGSELAVTREQVDTDSEAVHLEEANKLLADARALAEELRAADSGG